MRPVPGPGARRKVDPHRAIIAAIVGDILAKTAVEQICPDGAGEAVVAVLAIELVHTRRPVQPVIIAGANDILDARQHIAFGPAPFAGARGQIDPNRARITLIIRCVFVGTAVQPIGAGTAGKQVGARSARDQIGTFSTI